MLTAEFRFYSVGHGHDTDTVCLRWGGDEDEQLLSAQHNSLQESTRS